MGDANTVLVAVLLPAAVVAFYVWQVVEWVVAWGRRGRLYAAVPMSLRPPMPPFLDGVAWHLAHLFRTGGPLRLALGEWVMGLLSWTGGGMVAGVAMLAAVFVVPAFGLNAAFGAFAVVGVGVMVPFIKAICRFYHPQPAPVPRTMPNMPDMPA